MVVLQPYVSQAATVRAQAATPLLGAPLHAMTRASDWRFRRSPLLRQQEEVPAAADVLVYSSAAAADEPEIVSELTEVGQIADGAERLARLNAALAPHGATVFDWQARSALGGSPAAACLVRVRAIPIPIPNPNP